MKNLLPFLLVIAVSYGLKAQQKNSLNFGVSTDIGFSTLKINDQKLNATVWGAGLNIGYSLNYLRIESGIDYQSAQLNFSSDGETEFFEVHNLKIPLGLKTVFSLNGAEEESDSKIGLLVGLGLYSNYYFKAKADHLIDKKNIGWNFGLYSELGIQLKPNPIWAFQLGIKNESDFGAAKKDGFKVKNNRKAFFLGLDFKL